MWVFGYGSLMWDDWERSFGALQRATAVLPGYRRAFNKKSVANWGSKLHPAPTLNLVASAGASCTGIAFQLPENREQAVLAYLRKREGRDIALRPMDLRVYDGQPLTAFVPVYGGANVLPDLPIHTLLAHVRLARGNKGSGIDYVRGIARAMRALGLDDPAVSALANQVETA